jgi:hypothetical protein
MSETDDFNYDEPWAMFADEDEPWKDLDRLLKWEEKLDTQAELGDAFGCSPSTISYWLDKARDNPEVGDGGEDIECRDCGGETPGQNVICDDCLDKLRHEDSKAEA